MIHCHANAGNLATRKGKMAHMLGIGYNILSLDYRAYGRSEGALSEQGIYKDIEACYDYALSLGYKSENILIYGASLGGGPATYLASTKPAKGLILEAVFTSIPDMAKLQLPFVPKFIVRTQFNNLERIKSVDIPLFMMHGDDDEVIPFEMGKAVYDAAQTKKVFHPLIAANHYNTYLLYPEMVDEIKEFFKKA